MSKRAPRTAAKTRMLLRELVGLRGQILSIALVVACGVATFVGLRSVYDSLFASRAAYYREHRFADVFATLSRAPEPVSRRLEAIPGVSTVQTRLVTEVTLDVPGLLEPAVGRLVSMPAAARHFHFHLVVLDGVFTGIDGEARFDEATYFSSRRSGGFALPGRPRPDARLRSGNPQPVPELDFDQTRGA